MHRKEDKEHRKERKVDQGDLRRENRREEEGKDLRIEEEGDLPCGEEGEDACRKEIEEGEVEYVVVVEGNVVG